MNFIKNFEDENIKTKLTEAFDEAYNNKFKYEFRFLPKINAYLLEIYQNSNFVIAYILKNFDLYSKEDDFVGERYFNLTDKRSRKIYLKFMKHTFPEYKEEYIKNLVKDLDMKKDLAIQEINSL